MLQVVSRSPGDLEPVFSSMLENAVRICGASFGSMFLFEGEHLRRVAMHNAPASYAEYAAQRPVIHYSVSGVIMRLRNSRRPEQTPDLLAEDRNDPLAKFAGARTVVTMPMLKHGELIGIIAIYRREVRPFTDKQVELLNNFAAQAVIAIENTRLLTELRELLEQQTATAEVLSVINSSPGDLAPVFDVMVEKALRLCQARCGALAIFEGDHYRAISAQGPPELAAAIAYMPIRIHPESAPGRLRRGEDVVHIQDIANTSLVPRTPSLQAMIDLGKARTAVWVSLRKDSAVVGFFSIYRQEVRPFSEREIGLVRNFAAQAVIAIENARLLTELHQRTDDLGRSVDELRALGEVSQAVNSTLDLQTVLETIVAKAAQLSSTDAGALYVTDDGREFHLRATYGMDRDLIDALGRARVGFSERNVAQMLAERQPVQVADLMNEVRSPVDEIVVRAGYRSRLAAPLFHGDDIVGLLVVRRHTPGAFPQNTVDLMRRAQ